MMIRLNRLLVTLFARLAFVLTLGRVRIDPDARRSVGGPLADYAIGRSLDDGDRPAR